MIIFSGVQPSGNLTLGNYLGAIRHWVRMQGTGQCIYCVVDLHAITVWQNPAELRAQTREIAATLLAAGIDPATSILFHQSAVAAHTQLAWLLNCVARIGWVNRMTQFKDKVGKDREGASVGLYTYPVLMAADILAYRATHVPVGEDQKQHVELARDIAQKFNADFGVDLFPLPEPVIPQETARVMSLRDGAVKMSKSDPSDYSRINLVDDAALIVQKIRKARTDFEPLPGTPDGLVDRPAARNLLGIYAALSDVSLAAACLEFEGQGFATFKNRLADVVAAHLAPITAELVRLRAAPDHLDAVLRSGAERAAAIAEPVVARAMDVVGLLPR